MFFCYIKRAVVPCFYGDSPLEPMKLTYLHRTLVSWNTKFTVISLK